MGQHAQESTTLIRKLRDDLLLFVYMFDVAKQRIAFNEEDIESLDLKNSADFAASFANIRFNPNLTDEEKAVEAWLSNSVMQLPKNIKMKLSFENYMKVLKQNANINKILTTYHLESYWETLRIKLNNYVHNNGRQFTSHNLITPEDPNLEIYLNNVNIRTSYITTFFLVLITMVDATLLSSTDMADYLDSGIDPPEDCQYGIASFIQEYVDNKVAKLHPELKEYLHNNNSYGMKIL